MNILYIHGMGGGGDSRIPSILKDNLNSHIPSSAAHMEVIVRTYDFDPEVAHAQICGWMEELHPVLVIGESLGSLHAIRTSGVPHILVSPSLNAPLYLGYLSFLALVPGVTPLLDRIYHPKPGDRQSLHFSFQVLRKYRKHRREALACSPFNGGTDSFYAFFGTDDHYRKSGIVRIGTWKKYFGKDTFTVYSGTHFMEEEYIISLLIPKIIEVLGL